MGKKKAKPPKPRKQETPQTTSVEQHFAASFRGPLPPPSMLAQYDEVILDGANRIMRLVEGQSAHRQVLEKTVVNGDSVRAYLGLGLGFVIAILFLAAAVYLITRGYTWPGTMLGTVDIVGLVSAFIYGSHSRRMERQDKDERVRRSRR